MLDFFCSSTQLYMLLSPYLGFIYILYLNLYYLVDDASMGWGSLMQTKHIFVLIHFKIMVKLAPYNIFRPTGNFLLAVLLWIFLLFEFNISYTVLSVPCGLAITCWERAYLLALFT